MKIRVLGCDGGQLPGFSSVSFLINQHLIIDAGSITSTLSMREQLKIKHILITHGHLDHIKDICFLGENLFLSGSTYPVELYSSEAILTDIRKNLFNGIIWPNFSIIPNKQHPIFSMRSIKKTLSLQHLNIRAIPVTHSHAALGYIISDEKSSIVISGDTGPTELLWEETNKLKNVKAIFLELSFPSSLADLAWRNRHLSPQLLLRELKKIAQKNIPIYLYHLKPLYFQKIVSEIKQLKMKRLHILKPKITLSF